MIKFRFHSELLCWQKLCLALKKKNNCMYAHCMHLAVYLQTLSIFCFNVFSKFKMLRNAVSRFKTKSTIWIICYCSSIWKKAVMNFTNILMIFWLKGHAALSTKFCFQLYVNSFMLIILWILPLVVQIFKILNIYNYFSFMKNIVFLV